MGRWNRSEIWRDIKRDRWLYLFLAPAFILLFIFCYIPIYGVVIAFQDFSGLYGIFSSPWVGLKHFYAILKDPSIVTVFSNTVIIGVLIILFGFPAPILLSLFFNEIGNKSFKRVSQSFSYLPYFISTVVIVGMMKEFLSMDGIINMFVKALGGLPVNFINDPGWFRSIYVVSDIWQGVGWGSILYLASISSIPEELYEAGTIDGASRLKKIAYITIPSLMPVISIQFILAMGGILGASFEKIILLYSPATYSTADVISTYVYRIGLQGANYSYGSAVGLLNSIISFFFVYASNRVIRKANGYSFW